jgi:hypothetical protein
LFVFGKCLSHLNEGNRAVVAAGWRTNRQNSSNKSKESQDKEITYVPTSVLKGGAVLQESTEIEVSNTYTTFTCLLF